MNSVKLDLNRLLGFKIIAKDIQRKQSLKLGAKVGQKEGIKLGAKIGVKPGFKGSSKDILTSFITSKI